MAKGLKLKVKKLCGLVPTFVEVTGEKLVGGGLFAPILNRVKKCCYLLRDGVLLISQIFRNKFYPGWCKNIRHLLKIKR